MASSDTLAQRIEWLLGIASALLVLALAGYLVHEATGPAGTLPISRSSRQTSLRRKTMYASS
jgi:hypothetical protein